MDKGGRDSKHGSGGKKAGKKRSASFLDKIDRQDDDDDDCDDYDDEATRENYAPLSQSEKKRLREKDRRGRFNSGFDDLKALLIQIDPEQKANDSINRVNLMARAVVIMRDLQEQNTKMKQQLQMQHGHRGSDTDLVTIAVPYLIPTDSHMPSSHNTIPPHHHHHHHHHHQQHPHGGGNGHIHHHSMPHQPPPPPPPPPYLGRRRFPG